MGTFLSTAGNDDHEGDDNDPERRIKLELPRESKISFSLGVSSS